jgi:ribonuclease HI
MPQNIRRNQQNVQIDLFDSGTLETGKACHSEYAVMHCDGASSGNPGDSGIGAVIYITDKDMQYGEHNEACRISEYIGIATNNIAEYTAFVTGLEKAVSLGIRRINIFLDSELIVRQINGIYKVKNKNLLPLWKRAMSMLQGFDEYKVTHVRREHNTVADFLATQAVKKKAGL